MRVIIWSILGSLMLGLGLLINNPLLSMITTFSVLYVIAVIVDKSKGVEEKR